MSLRVLVVCPPGLEAVVTSELTDLGFRPRRAVLGGVPVDVSEAGLYGLNLQMRTATRVLVRLANGFVDGPQSLERLIVGIDWPRYVDGCSLIVNATAHSSTLFHTGMIEEITAEAISQRARLGSADDAPVQRVSVRIDHDRAMVSIDSSGERLDRRGYRLEGARAPMRETLAAALVLSSGWDGRSPLLDPFCGSGTIAIEAALIAAGRAPGLGRGFAFQRWPSFTRKSWRAARTQAEGAATGRSVVIVAADRDRGAIEATVANADRADVVIDAHQAAFSTHRPVGGPGWVVTNPPYGVRVGETSALRDLYDGFGNWLRAAVPGWTLAMVEADPRLGSRLRLDVATTLSTDNGGIKVRFVRGRIPDATLSR